MDDKRAYSLMFGENGMLLVDDTNAHTESFKALIIREDTVIDAWTDDNGLDLVAYFGIDAVTLLVTDPILVIPGGRRNGSLTLDSGTVWLVR